MSWVHFLSFLSMLTWSVLGHNNLEQDHQQGMNVSLELLTPNPDLLERFPYYLSGFDDDERPIWIIEFGKWNVRGEVDEGGDHVKNISQHINQLFWRIAKSIELKSTPEFPVNDGILIIDMDGFNLLQASSAKTTQFLFEKAREINPTAPLMEKGFFLNVNYVAQALLNILQPVMGGFIAKSDIYGTNRAKWIPDILRKLPRKALPTQYGGLAEEPVEFYVD